MGEEEGRLAGTLLLLSDRLGPAPGRPDWSPDQMCDGLTQLRVPSTPRVKVEVVRKVVPQFSKDELTLIRDVIDNKCRFWLPQFKAILQKLDILLREDGS